MKMPNMKMPFSKKDSNDDLAGFAVYAGGSKKQINMKEASPSHVTVDGKNPYSSAMQDQKSRFYEAQANMYAAKAKNMEDRTKAMSSRSSSGGGGSRGSMFGKVGPVLKGGLNIGPQSGAFAAVNPFAQLNQSIYFGFTQMGMVFLFFIGWFIIGKYGGYTLKGSVGAFASTPMFYILMVEVVNMIFNFFYLMTSGSFKVAERFANLFVLLMMLSGVAVIPIFVGFTTTYLALSGVLVLFAWVYIVCPGNPVFNIPFGFFAIYLVCVLLCMVGGIGFTFKLGFEPVVPLFQQIFNAIMGLIR